MGKIAALTAIIGTVIGALTFYFGAYLPYIEGEDTPLTTAFSPVINVPDNANPSPLIATIVANSTVDATPADFYLRAVASGGAPPYSYDWDSQMSSYDAPNVIEGEAIYVDYGVAGKYTHTLTVTDDRGQTASDSVVLDVKEGEPFGDPGAVRPVRPNFN
jgi:hypothetical protein